MLFFPNCKINLGLHVVEKRPDGFHNIETVFYPVNWCDALEVIENKNGSEPISISSSGLEISGALESNLIYKAWEMISAIKKMPPIQVHLYKNIPMGAGLGGGSADAAFFINMVDSKFMLNLSEVQKTEIASKLGSDCAFFLKNTPVIALGKGNEFTTVKIDLSKYYILLVYPNIHSDTKAAYQGLSPKKTELQLKHIIENMPISQWKQFLVNDFENTIFVKYPEIKQLKEDLYKKGALYASLSGSGSAVFGIYDKMPELNFPEGFKYFLQNPDANVL